VLSGRYNSADGWLEHTGWVARTETLIALLAGIADPLVEAPSADQPGKRLPGAWTRTAPGVYVVSAKGDTEFTTISDALSVALPGEEIRVLPGVYRESMRLEQPVAIIGEGRRTEIVIDSPGAPCITAELGGFVCGVSMRVTEPAVRRSMFDRYASIRVIGGEFDVRDCEIAGTNLAGVQVDDGFVKIDACRIRGKSGKRSHSRGLLQFGGVTEVKGCQFAGCDIGIEVRRASCLVESCQIQDNHTALYVAEYGRATMVDCLANRGLYGVSVGHGHLTMRECKVNENQFWGVTLASESKATFEDNDFSDNGDGAIKSDAPRSSVKASGSIGEIVWE
jgi:F-box protein 11